MNWLAHVFLSETEIDHQLVNLLADPLKGKVWPNASLAISAGMKLHSQIDSFTDQHPCVLQSKSRLAERGYLKGVVVDVIYDYFLSRHWNDFSSISKNDFLTRFYSEASQTMWYFPDDAKGFTQNVVRYQPLSEYGQLQGIEATLLRIDKRLSERILKRESASNYYPKLVEQLDSLEQDFLVFFPELRAFVKQHVVLSKCGHWRMNKVHGLGES